MATRVRVQLAPTFEWAVAAAFLAATLGVGSLLVRELHIATGPATRPALAEPAQPPTALPARAVSVPALLLMDGTQVRVGDSQEATAGVLGAAAEVGMPVVDQGAVGPRHTHFYEHRGTRFVLVFEPFERGGAPRVAAIYLQ
jgi:hypothetical protein